MSTATIAAAVYSWLKATTPNMKWYPEFNENSTSDKLFGTYSISDALPVNFAGSMNYGIAQPTVTLNVYAKDFDQVLALCAPIEAQNGYDGTLGTSTYECHIDMQGPFGGIRFDDVTRFYQASYNVDIHLPSP